MKTPTKRQHEVLTFIAQHIHHSGMPPSLREISKFLGVSSYNTARNHIKLLEKKGYLKRHPARGLVLLESPPLLDSAARNTCSTREPCCVGAPGSLAALCSGGAFLT